MPDKLQIKPDEFAHQIELLGFQPEGYDLYGAANKVEFVDFTTEFKHLLMPLMNVALNLLLIPMAGTMGAIAATLASHLFYAAANLIPSRRRLQYRLPWRPILHYGTAATGLLVAAANTLLPAGAVVLIAGGGILYLTLLWWREGSRRTSCSS